MSIFKETADKAKRDVQVAQQQLKDARAASLAKATHERESISKEFEQKFQLARKLLGQVEAQELLIAIRDDVWGEGKVTTSRGSFEVKIDQQSGEWSPAGEWSPDPFHVVEKVNEWPRTQLMYFKKGLPKKHDNAIVGFGRGSMSATRTWWENDGEVYSGLTVTAQFIEEKLGICVVSANSNGKHDDFFINPLIVRPRETLVGILQKIVYEDVRTGRLPQDLVRQAIEAAKSG